MFFKVSTLLTEGGFGTPYLATVGAASFLYGLMEGT